MTNAEISLSDEDIVPQLSEDKSWWLTDLTKQPKHCPAMRSLVS